MITTTTSLTKGTSSNVRCIEEEGTVSENREFGCFKVVGYGQNEENICCTIGGKNIMMVIDSGCKLEVIVVFDAPICVGNRNEIISSFYVIKNGKQSLLGREASLQLKVLKLGLDVNHIEEKKQPFPKIHGIKVSLSIDHTVKPGKSCQ